MIRTVALSKRFGDKTAVEDLSLEIAPGEVMGFLGPNGSGKTTTIRLLMGLLRPTSGHAEILGRDCHTDAVALKHDIGYLPDEPFLYPYLSGLELLELAASLHGMSKPEARLRAAASAEKMGLAAEARAFTITYSHGMKKRLALAAALIHEPRVLILDEPTNGLDPRGARDMRQLIESLAKGGRTIFLSTHLLDVAERVCHRLAIIRKGKLEAVGTPADLRARFGGADTPLEDIYLRATDETAGGAG